MDLSCFCKKFETHSIGDTHYHVDITNNPLTYAQHLDLGRKSPEAYT